MKLTHYTDYSLRLLVHLAANPNRLFSIAEIARRYGISHNHLTKVAHDLRKTGYVDAVRGRSGGIKLARPAEEITVGEVVRHTETGLGERVRSSPDLALTQLMTALDLAMRAYMETLDRYTLADLADADDDIERKILR